MCKSFAKARGSHVAQTTSWLPIWRTRAGPPSSSNPWHKHYASRWHHDHHDNQANLNRPGSASWSQTVHWHLRGPFGKHQSYRNSVSSPCDLQTDQDNLKLSRHFMINTTNTHKKSLQACTQPRQYRQYCKLKVQLQRKHEKIMLARIDPFQQPRLQRCRSRAHIFSSWTVHHLSSRHSRHTLFVWQRMTTNTHH